MVDRPTYNAQRQRYRTYLLFREFPFWFSIYLSPVLVDVLHSTKSSDSEENPQLNNPVNAHWRVLFLYRRHVTSVVYMAPLKLENKTLTKKTILKFHILRYNV